MIDNIEFYELFNILDFWGEILYPVAMVMHLLG